MNETRIQPLEKLTIPDNQPIVAIDFDGVITRPNELKSEVFDDHGYAMSPSETSREYCLNVADIDLEVYETVSRKVNVEMLKHVPLRNGVIPGLELLVDRGLLPIVITSRYDAEVEPMLEYIRSHELPIAGYANTNRGSKAEIVSDIDARTYTDDSYYKLNSVLNCEDFQNILIFFRHPSNSHVDVNHSDIEEVACWDNLTELILENEIDSHEALTEHSDTE